MLVKGLKGAVDPEFHRVDLRSQYSPTVQQALVKVLGPLGIPIGEAVCIPVDVDCTTNPNSPPPTPSSTTTTVPRPATELPRVPATSPAPSSTARTTTTRPSPTITLPPNPLDQLLGVLAAPANPVVATAAPSTAERIGGGVGRVGRFLSHAAGALFGGWR